MSARLEELRSSSNAVKEEVSAQREAAQAQAQRIAELRSATEAQRSLMVSSPAKIKGEVQALSAAAEAEQRALDDLDARRRILGRQLEVVAKADKDITKAMTLMGEAEVSRSWPQRCAAQSSAAAAATRDMRLSSSNPLFLPPPPPLPPG
jgi:hypothetical protein